MSGNGKIPFLDLVTPHRELEEGLVSVFRAALHTGGFVGGPMVEEFEREFAKFCGTEFCVGVASGTDALRFALIAAGVKPGETVITVPNTFVATTEAISQSGALPEFVDVDERTYNMDPGRLQEFLQRRCRIEPSTGNLIDRKTGSPITAIVPVHLYGQMADMDRILDLVKRHNLLVIEDACQAHGAEYFSEKENRWRTAGSMGRAAAFSFYPGKNLGACGEAGAVTTNDSALAHRVRMLRDHGQSQKYFHEIEGYNGRLDAIQAGILRAKLQHLPEWNKKRRVIARQYEELFKSERETIILPCESPRTKSVHHLYVIRVKNRDQVQAHLSHANIATQIHYPVPLHLQKAYMVLRYKEGDFPVAERHAAEILSLPMYPQLEQQQQKRVADELIQALGRAAVDRPHGILQETEPGRISI